MARCAGLVGRVAYATHRRMRTFALPRDKLRGRRDGVLVIERFFYAKPLRRG